MEEEYLQILIKKYINGTATPAEREELLSWYRNKTDNEFLWPYKNQYQEKKAKARTLQNLQQQIKRQSITKRRIVPLYYQVAAAIVILAGSFFIYQRSINSTPNTRAVGFTTASTKTGEHKVIKLSDGSVIWLSAGSSITYPVVFNKPTREITFEGEAFFEIAKDKKHPFIVNAGKTSTRVLGTSFNISAIKNKQAIVVSLITGKVAFAAGPSQLKLLPGYQAVYNKLTNAVKQESIPNMADVVARHNGDYEYKNVKVAAVIEDVNLNFNTHFQVAGKVENCSFYGRLKPGESPENFLKKLAIIENATVIQINNSYTIKGGGCD